MRDFLMGRGANPFAALLSSILLLLAVASAAAGHAWDRPGAFAGTAILLILAILIPRCLIIANQWERMIVLRLGKLQGIRGPGLFLIIPFIDTVATTIDQRIQTTA